MHVHPLAKVLGLLLLFVVPACTHEEEGPLRVGTLLWPGGEPLFLARELGMFEEGSVRLVEYSSSGEMHRAFRNGLIDAANVTLDMALQLQQQGLEPRVVLVMDCSNGADALLARPEVRRLEELRGRRVAMEDMAVSTYMLGRALERAGLEPSDIQIVRIPLDQQVRAYEAGEVDAVVTFEPFVSQLRAAGARTLFDSRQLPGEIFDVLVVRGDRLDAHSEQVEQLLQGWFQALRYREEHPDEAAARMSPRLAMSPEEFSIALAGLRLPSLEENLQLVGQSSAGLLGPARRLQHIMRAEGMLHEPGRPEELLDDRFLVEVQKQVER